MERMMNRPSLPPLRLALAQYDDPEHLGPPPSWPKHDRPSRLGCSIRSNSDLSLYSLSSSSSQRGSSTSSFMPSPSSSRLAERARCDAYSSMAFRENHSLTSHRQCSTDFQRTSGSRPYTYSRFRNYSTETCSEKPHQVENFREQPGCHPQSLYCAVTRGNSSQYEDIPARTAMVVCHSNSNPTPADVSHDHHQARLEPGSSSTPNQSCQFENQGLYNQTLSTSYHRNTTLTEPIPQAWKVPGDGKHQSSSEFRSQSRIQPTETASGPRYFCPVWGCGKSFTRNFNLTQHISAIHRDERRFECSYCIATFYRRNDLTRHERAHTGERPYHCECGQGFTRTDLLARHKHSGNCTHKKML